MRLGTFLLAEGLLPANVLHLMERKKHQFLRHSIVHRSYYALQLAYSGKRCNVQRGKRATKENKRACRNEYVSLCSSFRFVLFFPFDPG